MLSCSWRRVASDGGMRNADRDQRGMGGLVVSIPPSSVSTTTTTTFDTSLTPRSFLSRWLTSLQKPRAPPHSGRGMVGCKVRFPLYHPKRRNEEHKREEEREVVAGSPLVDPRTTVTSGGVEAAPPPLVSAEGRIAELSASSGWKPDKVSRDVGMGVGLIFLLAKSSNELKKMTQLQEQIAMLLRDVKEEIQRKKLTSNFIESSSANVFSVSNYRASENTSNPDSWPNNGESDDLSKCKTKVKKKKIAKMNRLESELEVELERLQLNMEEDKTSVVLQQNNPEFVGENFNPSESYSVSFVEASEPKETSHCGVCPHELERRLHELLESRQQERIMELEFALECAEKKLQEKEVQVCWWRDTARLVSKHREEALFL